MKFYITTPIYYVNDIASIGHAYTTFAGDTIARWHRMKGEDVFFLTGLDENSQKTVKAAEKAGIKDLKEYTNQMALKWITTWKNLNISNDGFIRTTENKHKKLVKEFFMKVYEKGDIYKGKYEGLYCEGCECFYTESDLVNGKCPFHKTEPKLISEENYFFKLTKYSNKILEYIEKNPNFILPNSRKNEVVEFIKMGLKDISISRPNVDWGIPLPIDKNHHFWVWFDALPNYITGAPKYWPANCHLLAKDILRFHCVIWPAMLMSAGYELPKQLFVHGFLTINGQKMSKSLGNAIDPNSLAEKYSADTLRYYLLRSIPFGDDGDFSEEALINRNNSELADALGNLLNRVISMCEKYTDSKIPKGKEDKNLSSKLDFKKIDSYIENYELHNALNEIWHFIDECNKYVNEKEPWNLAKNNKQEELQSVLFNLAEGLRIISQLVYPFIPETSLKIEEQLGFKHRDEFDLKWGNAKSKSIKKGETLFKKI
ncbi:MAG: methionine--tRNA ligase [Candidatus Nanoarchaeia archaeon]|nr:methionine--tRNA ligase [Candidatus Nanoarchaeia archaeon]